MVLSAISIFHRFTQSPWFCWTAVPFFIEFSDFSDSVFIPKPFSDSLLILTPFFKFKLSDTVRFLDGCSLKAKFLKALSFPSLLSTNESDSLSSVQVNLCQKLLFLHQLTHNMTTDCSLNYKFNIWNSKLRTWREHVVYRNCFWHSEPFFYTTCSAKRRASDKDLPVNFGKFFIFGVSVSSISAGNETERKLLSGWSSIWTWGSEFLLVF